MLDWWEFEHAGRRYRAEVHHDSDMGAPWEEHYGHGPVSDWTIRDKRPGELVLSVDSRGRASMRAARAGLAVAVTARPARPLARRWRMRA